MNKNTSLFFKLTKVLFTGTLIFSVITAISCVSTPRSESISRELRAPGIKSARSLENFFLSNNPDADKKTVRRLSKLYIAECAQEGINSDCAFVQMCLETGFLRFGNLVTKDMHNYCGLGAIDSDHPGERFETEQQGVRAHVQHLHAYATPAEVSLKNTCIDKRYKWVKRGRAQDIFGLAGTWAADTEYGAKLDGLLAKLENF